MDETVREQAGDWMERALELAAMADFETSPNPMVGAVVVQQGVVVGEGYHRRAGGPHAEVLALGQAGDRARGASLWVTLEPCCTFGRTGPCTALIVAAGVVQVNVAVIDPNPKVQGRGVAALRAAGIEVVVGDREREATRLIEHHRVWTTTGLPFLTLKLAMTLDGKVATSAGESQWITSELARADGHRLRHTHDAIMVGSGTVLRDDPSLTARLGFENGRQPVRVVMDGRLRTPPYAKFLREGSAPVLVVAAGAADPVRRSLLEKAGAEVIEIPTDDRGRPSVRRTMELLGGRGVTSLLVEGGPTLLASLWEERLGNRIVAFVSPDVLGGQAAPGPFGGDGAAALSNRWQLRWTESVAVGPDLRLTAEV